VLSRVPHLRVYANKFSLCFSSSNFRRKPQQSYDENNLRIQKFAGLWRVSPPTDIVFQCMRTAPKTVEGVAKFDMRQKDFSAGRTRARLRQARLFTLLTTLYDFDVPLVATIRAVERRSRARMNIDHLQFRTLSISRA
jgi:hypothetical protein